MGPLFSAALVLAALSTLILLAFVFARVWGRKLVHSATIAVAFGLGAACAGALASFLSAAVLGKGLVLNSVWQVAAYLGYLATACMLGGFLVAQRVWRAETRWDRP